MAATCAIPNFPRPSTLDGRLSPGWDDMATARNVDELPKANGLSGQQELPQITAALARLGNGPYRVFAKCDGEPGQARLNARPYTPYCRT